jgi:hypothetical protein
MLGLKCTKIALIFILPAPYFWFLQSGSNKPILLIGETIVVTTYIGTVRNGKVEFAPPLTLPEGSQVRVTLSPVLNERQAAGKVNVWLAHQVGDAVGVMQGTLVQVEERAVWRFEAFITGVNFDPVGPLGQIEVDADTGEMLSSPKTAEAMIERGRQLAPVP